MNAPATRFANLWNIKAAGGMEQYLAPALAGGVAGAGVGGVVQLVRKLMQSRRDEEENGSPSILNGMLAGGLGGAGLGAGLQYWSGQPGGAPRGLQGTQLADPTMVEAAMRGGSGAGPHTPRIPQANPLRQTNPPPEMMPMGAGRSSIPMSSIM